MALQIGDQQAFQDWQAHQHLDEEDQHPTQEPVHPLDPNTLTAMILLLVPPMGSTNKLTAGQVRFAMRRFFVLAAVVNPEIGAGGFTVMADAMTKAGIPTTRACLSTIYTELAEITGSTALGKKASARAVYAERAKKVWALRRTSAKRATRASMGQE